MSCKIFRVQGAHRFALGSLQALLNHHVVFRDCRKVRNVQSGSFGNHGVIIIRVRISREAMDVV